MKKSTLTVCDSEGRKYTWKFWRDERSPATWMLQTHDGYTRTLERTWRESASRIIALLYNYGVYAEIS